MLFPVKARRSGPRIREVEYKELNLSEVTKPYKVVCDNCLKTYTTYKDEEGKITFRCPACGTKIRIRKLARRYVVKELRYP